MHETAARARKVVQQDGDVDSYWRNCLKIIGYEGDASYLDRIRLRVVPPTQELGNRMICPLPPHRDTWGSGIMAQINWWLPIYPVAATRTMILWPRMFRRAIANDSTAWEYESAVKGDRNDPLLPTATEALDEPGLPVVIDPGELLAFSAAHLHASATDASGQCRLNVDIRTVWTDDRRAGRSAPNVDGKAACARWEWFRRATS